MRLSRVGIFLLVACRVTLGFAAVSEESQHEKCGVIANIKGEEIFIELASLRVSELTATNSSFELPADAPQHVSAVQCGRNSIVPAGNDYKVLEGGFPFSIVAPNERVLVMELVDGQVQVRALNGMFTSDEVPRIQAFANQVQEHFYVDSAKSVNKH